MLGVQPGEELMLTSRRSANLVKDIKGLNLDDLVL